MSLETDIQTAYEEQEAVETTARELEARIRKIDGAARCLCQRVLMVNPLIVMLSPSH